MASLRSPSPRGRRTVRIAAGLAIAAVAGAAFASRHDVEALWWSHRLGSEDPAVRESAARRLASVYPRLGRLGSRRAANALAAAGRKDPPVEDALRRIAVDVEFAEVFRAVLAARGREGLEEFLFGLCVEDGERIVARGARDHPDPVVRATALKVAVTGLGFLRFVGPGPERRTLLLEAWDRDPDTIVRREALLIAGKIPDREGNIDLRAVVLSERDPVLLAAAIEARDRWAYGDGETEFSDERSPWTSAEIERLEEILRESRDPALRAAASAALEHRDRDL